MSKDHVVASSTAEQTTPLLPTTLVDIHVTVPTSKGTPFNSTTEPMLSGLSGHAPESLKGDQTSAVFSATPVYFWWPSFVSHTKRKPRPRSSTYRSPRKRARESSCETEEQRASPTTCSDRTDAASVNEADVALTSETVETYHTDTACQTDRLVDCASCAAVQKLRCQLRAVKQQLRQCQTKLAEFRKKTAKYERQQQSLQRLSDREKLIIDQCVMKANAKSGLILVKSKGFLLVPSSQLVTLLQIVEDHMEAHTVEKTACSGVYMNIVEDVLMDPRTASAAVGCKSHFVSTTAEVVQFFLKVRLHFFYERKKQTDASERVRFMSSRGW
ncbi:uncharacterized protein LOC142766139 [Rhipicephalus microplus]|uniref:uncharacterized protein LOC142766139 n=1 Tax=Rhipicephalus microplus TaxID=6941 RepID=UPI003F6CC10B